MNCADCQQDLRIVNSFYCHINAWMPLPQSWLKCNNIGSSLDKSSEVVGSVWVLRNKNGKVLLHSGKYFFFGFHRLNEASLEI